MACRPFFFPFFLSPFLYFHISIPHDHHYHLKSTFSSSPPTSNTASTVSPVSGMYNSAYQCDNTQGSVPILVWASHAHWPLWPPPGFWSPSLVWALCPPFWV